MDYHLSLYFSENFYKIIDFTELSIILISQLEYLYIAYFTFWNMLHNKKLAIHNAIDSKSIQFINI